MSIFEHHEDFMPKDKSNQEYTKKQEIMLKEFLRSHVPDDWLTSTTV